MAYLEQISLSYSYFLTKMYSIRYEMVKLKNKMNFVLLLTNVVQPTVKTNDIFQNKQNGIIDFYINQLQ